MLRFIVQRLAHMVVVILLISMISFVIIQLPPGDYLSTFRAAMIAQGIHVEEGELRRLIELYGLDRPVYEQYFYWLRGIVLRGDFGMSFEWNRPVTSLMLPRFGWSLLLAFLTMGFSLTMALFIGVLSAVKPYSIWDYFATSIGFLGLAIPNFMLALVLMYLLYMNFGITSWGLTSREFLDQPWNIDRIFDTMSRAILPVIVIGSASTAGLIRVLRATLLDELNKPYIQTARSKGVFEMKIILKYPVRLALIPFVSYIGIIAPAIFGQEVIASIVLGLPTAGPMFLRALQSQDMYLAGSFVLLTGAMTVVAVFLSDLILAHLDPRIRYG